MRTFFYRLAFLIFLTTFSTSLFSQTKTLDSLRTVIKVLSKKEPDAARDTNFILAKYFYGEFATIFRVTYWDSLAKEAAPLAEKYRGQRAGKAILVSRARALNNAGFVASAEGHIDVALDYYNQCLKIWKDINSKFDIAFMLKTIAMINEDQGKAATALDLLHQSLKIFEELKDKRQVGIIYNDLGVVYNNQQDSANSLYYHRQSLKIKEETNDREGLATSNTNIGAIYKDSRVYDKAVYYFNKGLAIYEETGNVYGIAVAYNNIGTTLKEKKDFTKALEQFKKALPYMEKSRDRQGEAIVLVNIAEVYYQCAQYKEAEEYALRSMKTSKELGFPNDIKYAALVLTRIYKSMNKYKEALDMSTIYDQMRDSIESESNRKAVAKKRFQAEYEQQAERDSIVNAQKIFQEQFKHEQEIRQQRIYTYGGIAGFVLMLVVAGVSYRAFRNKRKANIIITQQKQIAEQQKLLIEEKQKEILDSIHYAQRIQYAILAKEEEIKHYFPESFLMYKPKDIVAGDFYFFEHTRDHVFYAAADCTGHGVPGALVSVVCSNALSRCVKEFELTDPGKILDKARELVLDTFRKSGQDVKDGMDISLIVKNTKTNQFTWAGANNPLWYMQNGEIHAIKANKQPIGLSEDPKPFTTREVPVNANDTIFLFTDGMADQFGGPKGKKFKYKQISELLVSAASKALDKQKSILEKTFSDWKGELEQVDDVCVIGLRV
jgi:serine phosphatase RsbU (regulator of sigma subunit)